MTEGPWPRALVAEAAWRASYDDPIRLRAGECLTLTGRDDLWDGHRWLWAQAGDGRQGWVPDTLVADGRAAEEYSARELSCDAGEAVTGLRATHGWVWCSNAAGAEGWIPARHLTDAR